MACETLTNHFLDLKNPHFRPQAVHWLNTGKWSLISIQNIYFETFSMFQLVSDQSDFLSVEQDFWMSILLDVGIGLEINVLTSKFILLGYQMLGEIKEY